jgi:TonB-linked SusC/RagA family outer membrane protein
MKAFRWLAVLLIGLAVPGTLLAQATVSGRVVSNTGQPLGAASVRIQGVDVSTFTRNDGTYILQVPAGRFTSGQEVQLIADVIGYSSQTTAVRLVTGQTVTQNFMLMLDPLRLDAIVATGAGIEQRRERVASVVATVTGQEIIRSNEPNVVAALAGKVPNVRATFGGGDPGASVAIQIRGAKSFGGSQPAIIIDGVPANNAVRAGSALGGSGFGAPAPNRAIDTNPEDIESIEILKGAAATSIYGAAAGSAGAIIITTKRGKPGQTRWSFRSTYQQDEAARYLPMQQLFGIGSNAQSPAGLVYTADDYTCATPNCNLSPFFSWGPRLPAGQPTYDHARNIFSPGRIFDNNIQVSGGTERTTFLLSVGTLNQDGFLIGNSDRFNRYTTRFNGSHALTENLTFGANASYAQTLGRGADRGNTTNGFGLTVYRMPPEFNAQRYLAENGLHRSYRFPNPSAACQAGVGGCSRQWDNPFYALNNHELTQETGRFFGSINANWRALPWLTVNYVLGTDYNSDDRTFALDQTAAGTSGGQINRWQFYDRIIDSNLTASASWELRPGIQTGLLVGQNLNETYFRQVDVTGQTWVAPRPFKLSNTAVRTPPNDGESRRRTEGYFAQGNLDLWDQLFVQGRLRYDGSSAFGIDNQRALYPGASVAWSFTRYLQLPDNIVSFGKLRFAYGESGQQPGLYQQQDVFTTGAFADFSPGSLQAPSLGGQGGLYPSTARGNTAIAPERVREFEGGFDLALFQGRADVGVTTYLSRSTDVIFGVGLPPSTGYTSVALNAGELENRGWEFTANYRPIMRQGLNWEIGGQWGMNRNKVVSLGAIQAQLDGDVPMPTRENCGDAAVLPRCQIGFGSSFGGQSTHAQVGFPVGIWRGSDFARCGRGLTNVTYQGTVHNVGAACAGAPDGALFIAPNGFPITDPNTRALGNPEPDWTAGISSVLNVRGFEISAFLDHRQGGSVLNMTRASMAQFGTHKDTETRGQQHTFGRDMICHNKTCDVLNGPVVGPGAGTAVEIGQGWWNGGANGGGQGAVGGPVTQRLEDGTNTRLREVSVGYIFRDGWVNRLGGASQLNVKVSGRNLGLWTNYSGLDPDVNLGGAANANRGIDWFTTPTSRAWVVSMSLIH